VGNVPNLFETSTDISAFTGISWLCRICIRDGDSRVINSVVLASDSEDVLLPLNEPVNGKWVGCCLVLLFKIANVHTSLELLLTFFCSSYDLRRRKSQIQTYLEQNEGAGLQHLALKTDDIFETSH
jgi:4-hydroxyphenylpyruvate dioxygenase